MRVVVVGAGAVGQVYGHHLALGGAEVAMYVRPARRVEAARVHELTRISPLGRRHTSPFRPSATLSTAAEVAALAPDQIWFCVPTTALDPALVRALSVAAPGSALVIFAPGHFVEERIGAAACPSRLVFGAVGMLSYPSPLSGSADPRELATPNGHAYLLSKTRLSSASERLALDAVAALRRGGVPADLAEDTTADVAFDSAVLMPLVASLQLSGWSFASFRAGASSALAARAAKEALAVTEALTGRAAPLLSAIASPLSLRLGSWLIPPVAPFDVEGFLRVHFTKVSDQTRLLVAALVSDAERLGLERAALGELLEGLHAPDRASLRR